MNAILWKQLAENMNPVLTFYLWGSAALTMRHSSSPQKLAIKFTDQWHSLSQYSSLAE
jgi:hypothetical protein